MTESSHFSRLQASISDLSISVYIQQTKDQCDGVIMHALQDNTYNAITVCGTMPHTVPGHDIICLHELEFVCLPQKSMYATAIAVKVLLWCRTVEVHGIAKLVFDDVHIDKPN